MRHGKIIAAILLAVVVAFGATTFFTLRSNDKVDAICLDLASQEKLGRIGIVAEGEFLSHNESFAYIGDIVVFELVVAHNPDKTNVGDKGLRDFNVSPFALLNKGSVSIESFDGCIVKRIHFTLRVVNVQIGEPNSFWTLSSDNILSRPSVHYTVNGKRKSSSVTYDKLFVASLTGGKIIPPRDIPEVVAEEIQEKDLKIWYVGGMVVGSWTTLLSVILAYTWRRSHKRKMVLASIEKPDSIAMLHPGFEMDGTPTERLTNVYFSLRKRLLKLSNKALIVFDENVEDEELERVLLDIRSTLEANEARYKGGEA